MTETFIPTENSENQSDNTNRLQNVQLHSDYVPP